MVLQQPLKPKAQLMEIFYKVEDVLNIEFERSRVWAYSWNS